MIKFGFLQIEKRKQSDINEWYSITLFRLVKVARGVSSKYTRSKVRRRLPKYLAYSMDELLHADDVENKSQYYSAIIKSIVDCGVAEEFIREKFPGFQAVITVQYHNDPLLDNKEHLHAHVVLNASSYENKNKIHITEKFLADCRDEMYLRGQKYNLTEAYWRDSLENKIAENEKKQARNNDNEYVKSPTELEKNVIKKHGKHASDYLRKEQLRLAIDEAATETGSIDGFRSYLKEYHSIKTKIENDEIKYKFTYDRNYIKGKSLGSMYELDAICYALDHNENRLDYQLDMTEKERTVLRVLSF